MLACLARSLTRSVIRSPALALSPSRTRSHSLALALSFPRHSLARIPSRARLETPQTAGIRAEISATQRRLAELNAELENAETDLRASTPPAPIPSSPSPTTSAASSAPDAPAAGAARTTTTTTTAAAAAPAKDARANLGAVWATFSRNPDAFGRRELRPLVRQGVPVELRREVRPWIRRQDAGQTGPGLGSPFSPLLSNLKVWPRCARIHKFNQLGFYGFMAQSPFRRPSAASKTIELVRIFQHSPNASTQRT